MFNNLMFIVFWSTLFALLAESMEVLHFFVVDDKIEGPELINIFKWFILNLIAMTSACICYGFESGITMAMRAFSVVLFLSILIVGFKLFQLK